MLPLFFILLPAPSFAFIAEKREGRLFLRSENCSELQSNVLALKKWTASTDRQKVCNSTSKTEDKGQCEFDVTDCVPEHVLKYQGAKANSDGPNCWNLVLVMQGVMPGLRYSSPEEFSFYMQPPLCRRLASHEQKMPGDIGAIRDKRTQEEVHGFIYVDENMIYSKNGNGAQIPFMLDSLSRVLRGYSANKAVSANDTTYFRCDSMEDYLKKNPGTPAELLHAFENIGQFEACLTETTVRGTILSNEATESLVETSIALLTYLQSERAKQELGKDPKPDFIMGALQLRLEGIAQQLSILEQKDASSLMWDFKEMVTKSYRELIDHQKN